jgi:DNA adenine methylase
MVRPFDTYNGGKNGNGTYQTIINNIPPFKIFIDAMCGNCGISSNLLPHGSLIVINDIDSCVTKALKDKINCVGHGNPGSIDRNSYLIRNENFQVLIDEFDCERSENVFFYFDPPYLFETRKGQRDLYNFEWNREDHRRFLQSCSTVKSNCMISHYPCDMYDNALSNWRKIEFQSMTRKGLRTEAIYMNYPPPTFLHQYNYLGKDFIDRQRIKRKAQRTIQKLKNLPPHERLKIFELIKQEFL